MNRKSLIRTISFLAILMLSVQSKAQDLDDAIHAELDDVSQGGSPSTEPSSAGSASASTAVDDIQLDDDNAKPKPTHANAAPAIVQDELKLEEGENGNAGSESPSSPTARAGTDLNALDPNAGATDAPLIDERKISDENPDLDLGAPAEGSAKVAKPSDSVPSTPATPTSPAPVERADALVIDEPNAAYEKRLSQMSEGYRPVPDVNWDEIVGERRQENYGLQRGDTLWDISETFFGDGFFWAKLWSQNGVIENPHMIVRGKGIRFVAGTEGDAPAIGVMNTGASGEVVSVNPFSEPDFERPTYREQVQAEVTPEEIESGVVLENDELIPAPELPPAGKRASVLKDLPASFPEQKVVRDLGYDASGLKVPPVRASSAPASIFVNSFITDKVPASLGKIDEIASQDHVAGTGQAVFVKLNQEIAMGTRVTFVRPRARASGALGAVIDVYGVGVIDGVVKESSNTYHATVTTALAPIENGALVIPEPPPRVTVDQRGARSESRVRIVGGEFDEGRKLFGTGAIIYLGGGKNAGLRKGDVLGVESTRAAHRETKYPSYKAAIAVIKVADVRDKVATAIVVTTTTEISIGDITSAEMPEDQPSLRNETADESAAAFGHREASERQ